MLCTLNKQVHHVPCGLRCPFHATAVLQHCQVLAMTHIGADAAVKIPMQHMPAEHDILHQTT